MFTLVCQARGGRHQCSACLMSRFKHQQIKGSMIISKDNLGFDYRVTQKLSFQAPLHCNKGGSIWASVLDAAGIRVQNAIQAHKPQRKV